jgi:hypothetical protein
MPSEVYRTTARYNLSLRAKPCVNQSDVKRPVQHDLILAPTRGCSPHSKVPAQIKYYNLGTCDNRHPGDKQDIELVKTFHGSRYIYCAGSTLAIDGREQPCTDNVFLLPIAPSFKINNFEYRGSLSNLNQQAKIDYCSQ